ncbi:MAG: protein-L-isoaspartate(D-aspartate) O-methyltransferase [Candidatus Binatia bacterium]
MAREDSSGLYRWDSRETFLERQRMVENQLAQRGIRDAKLLEAMRVIPRHLFVRERDKLLAYADGPILLGFGQTISQPYIVALMTEALELTGKEKVLEVGTGSGYQAAILSHLAKRVYTVERIGELVQRAKDRMVDLEIFNVKIVCGNGTLGLPEEAPFDAIVVTAGAPDIPDSLIKQLVQGGRLVLPVGDSWEQDLLKLTKKGEVVHRESLGLCTFVRLLGREGWKDN